MLKITINKPTLIVLDYRTGSVHIYHYDIDSDKSAEELCNELHGNIIDCHYMCSNTLDLSINSCDE